MVLASIVIQVIAWTLLLVLCYVGRMSEAPLDAANGLWAFLSMSFAMDTSIAVEKVQAYLQDRFSIRIANLYIERSGKSELPLEDDDAGLIFDYAKRYVNEFAMLMKFPKAVYPFFGIAFALAILVICYLGFAKTDPICRYVVLAPLPALAYYFVSLCMFSFVYLHFSCECSSVDNGAEEKARKIKAKILQLVGEANKTV